MNIRQMLSSSNEQPFGCYPEGHLTYSLVSETMIKILVLEVHHLGLGHDALFMSYRLSENAFHFARKKNLPPTLREFSAECPHNKDRLTGGKHTSYHAHLLCTWEIAHRNWEIAE